MNGPTHPIGETLDLWLIAAFIGLAARGLAGPPAEDSTSAALASERARLAAESITLTEDSLPAWRDHILPTPEETRWQAISWLPTFSDGLARAEVEQKPLLLWVMNGHPLGCT